MEFEFEPVNAVPANQHNGQRLAALWRVRRLGFMAPSATAILCARLRQRMQ